MQIKTFKFFYGKCYQGKSYKTKVFNKDETFSKYILVFIISSEYVKGEGLCRLIHVFLSPYFWGSSKYLHSTDETHSY